MKSHWIFRLKTKLNFIHKRYTGKYHYENMPIQIHWKFLPPKDKKKNSDKKNLIFFIFLLKTDIVGTR